MRSTDPNSPSTRKRSTRKRNDTDSNPDSSASASRDKGAGRRKRRRKRKVRVEKQGPLQIKELGLDGKLQRLDELVSRVTSLIVKWFASRRYGLLLQASPAIVVCILIAVAVVDQRGGAGVRNISRYNAVLRQAIHGEDAPAAEVYTQKLGQLDPKGFDARFGTAWLAERH